ncbi:hypothetical protein ACM1RC_19085 [Paenibacillus azoreducens]|uniref:hypothetical protein n=1 Tax=Paenibacillus azoreducens TaxID=116718 RepID=UPI0039F4D88F
MHLLRLKKAANSITEGISKAIGGHTESTPLHAEIIKTHQQENFAITMVPILLGFISYIATMTVNVHLRLSSLVLKKKHAKWKIFWSRQLLLLLVSIFIPLIIVSIIHLFVEPAAPFWKMWLFESCVFLRVFASRRWALRCLAILRLFSTCCLSR